MKWQEFFFAGACKTLASQLTSHLPNLLSYGRKRHRQDHVKPSIEVTIPTHILNPLVESWKRGHWEEVVHGVTPHLSNYPNSSMLALLRASAQQQLGRTQEAKFDYQLAIKTGCNPETAKRIMLAGALTAVAEAAGTLGDQERAAIHGREASRILGISDNQQLQSLGPSMHQDSRPVDRM